ncbi:MAG: PQQ-binding-like beta-propeller repeat protein [Gemmatales bacterium]|nr:PQQ-binding-like beta-propeller repeat protein [Gemmatales bacterium]MDW8385835.1 PQQ-binding-like beta-propeller repeat protein [Gemmatales bacterium]
MPEPKPRTSIFTSPFWGTLLYTLPAVALIALAYVFANYRVRHALGLLWLGYGIPLIIIGVLAGLLLLLALITVARSMRLTDPPPPSRAWSCLPFLAGIVLAGFVTMAFLFGHRPVSDLSDPDRLTNLQSAKLESDTETESSKDWPQWRGPRRDGISRETGLNLDWKATPPRVLWEKPVSGGYSSPSVADGRVYVTDRDGKNERVLCFDAETGEELWVYSYPNDYGNLEYGAGPRATPTVHDGRVYTLGATGTFLCLEATPADRQPKVLWRHDLMDELDTEPPRWGVASSPLIEKDLVIVMPGGPNGCVTAFDRVSGKLVWKALGDVGGYSSPIACTAAGARQIICLTGEALHALKPEDGSVLWSYPWVTTFEGNIATPIVAGNYVFISSSYNKGCALLEIFNDGGKFRAEPVYVRANKLMRNHHSTCVLVDGYLYGFDVNTNNNTAFLRCVDFRRGEERWADRSLTKGSLIFADGCLLIQTEDGQLVVVEATPEGFRTRGEMKVFDSFQTWATPALVHGRLYVRDGKRLRCLDLRPPAKGP